MGFYLSSIGNVGGEKQKKNGGFVLQLRLMRSVLGSEATPLSPVHPPVHVTPDLSPCRQGRRLSHCPVAHSFSLLFTD